MDAAARKLIAEFELLSAEEKLSVAKEILFPLPVFDSQSLNDDEVALTGDHIAALLVKEENQKLF
jgi:hypothetical protein